jgi:hypothetical protein
VTIEEAGATAGLPFSFPVCHDARKRFAARVTPMNIQSQIDDIKALLSEAETNYQHAMAAGDWTACAAHKNDVAKYRRVIGQLVKQKLTAS